MSIWALIYNPSAGNFRPERMEAVCRALNEEGLHVTPFATTHPGHATELGRAIEGVDTIAVFGGDGTLNEALNGLLGRNIPLAFIPGGTANVMAHEMGLPFHPVKAAKALASGQIRPVRPGVINSRAFLLMAGFGYDGEAVAAVSPKLKRWFGKGAYVLSGFQVMLRSRPPLRVEVKGNELRLATFVVVARASHYAGPYLIHGAAGLEQSRLGLVSVSGWRLPSFLAGRFLLRRPPGTSTASWLPETGCTVWSESPIAAQVDGEFLGAERSYQVGLSEHTVPLHFPAQP